MQTFSPEAEWQALSSRLDRMFETAPENSDRLSAETKQLVPGALWELGRQLASAFEQRGAGRGWADDDRSALEDVGPIVLKAKAECEKAGAPDALRMLSLLVDAHDMLASEPELAEARASMFDQWHEAVHTHFVACQMLRNWREDDRATWLEQLWALLHRTLLAGLTKLGARLAFRFCVHAADAIKFQLAVGNQVAAVPLRGRYRAAWYLHCSVQPTEVSERASAPGFLWAPLAEELSQMHARTAALKDLLGEGLPSAAARELDISVAFRGTSKEEWREFYGAYDKGQPWRASFKAKSIDLKQLAAQHRPIEYFGVESEPDSDLVANLSTVALADGAQVIDHLEQRLESISTLSKVEDSSHAAAMLARDASGLLPRVHAAAAAAYGQTIWTLLLQEDLETAAPPTPVGITNTA